MTFADELRAIAAVYEALVLFPMHERDRILRHVNERLARERRAEPRLSTRDASDRALRFAVYGLKPDVEDDRPTGQIVAGLPE